MTEYQALQVRTCGDDLLSIAVANVREAQSLAALLRPDSFWLEVVPGLDSVVVQYDAAQSRPEHARARLEGLPRNAVDDGAGKSGTILEIAVCYGGEDGPDLARVCSELGMSPTSLVALHTGTDHRVEMLGFMPGFAYVSGLDPRLCAGRLAAPRQRVPAGAVGINGAYTGLYALPGPGGWPIIGRAAMRLFDGAKDDPFLLRPGQSVRFMAECTSGG